MDHLRKITRIINRGSFTTLVDTECSQILAEQTNASLNAVVI